MPVLLIVGLILGGTFLLAQTAKAAEDQSPATVLPGVAPGGVAAESTVAVDVVTSLVTGGIVGGVVVGVDALLQNAEDRRARIAAEGTWQGQIRVFIVGLPAELVRSSTVKEMATSIVHQFGFGGAWRMGFADPILGMQMVLTNLAQDTENLRAIGFTYQDTLRKSFAVPDQQWIAALGFALLGVGGPPIIALGLQPHASEMRNVFVTGGLS